MINGGGGPKSLLWSHVGNLSFHPFVDSKLGIKIKIIVYDMVVSIKQLPFFFWCINQFQ